MAASTGACTQGCARDGDYRLLSRSVNRQCYCLLLRCLIALLLLAFFAFLIWWGLLYVERTQYQSTAATQISFSYIYAAMPVGGLLLILMVAMAVVAPGRFSVTTGWPNCSLSFWPIKRAVKSTALPLV